MFADHLLEIFDHLERDVVFFVTEIHERARVGAMFWNIDLYRVVRVNLWRRRLFAGGENANQRRCYTRSDDWTRFKIKPQASNLQLRSRRHAGGAFEFAPTDPRTLIARKIAFQMQ